MEDRAYHVSCIVARSHGGTCVRPFSRPKKAMLEMELVNRQTDSRVITMVILGLASVAAANDISKRPRHQRISRKIMTKVRNVVKRQAFCIFYEPLNSSNNLPIHDPVSTSHHLPSNGARIPCCMILPAVLCAPSITFCFCSSGISGYNASSGTSLTVISDFS